MSETFFSNDCPRTATDSHRSVLHTNGRAVVHAGTVRKREALNKRTHSIRCEALSISVSPSSPGSPRPGEQCAERATHDFDGRWVCWVHWKAATVGPRAGSRQVQSRGERIPAVEFVAREERATA